MQKYHPTRVITLTYQPFILTTTAIFTYHEAKVNTRMRNLAGYILFFLSSFAATIVSITDCTRMFLFEQLNCCTISHMFTNLFSYVTAECCNFRKRWNGTLYWHAAAFVVADGHVQGGMTGDLSLMCPEFIQVHFGRILFLWEDSRNTV